MFVSDCDRVIRILIIVLVAIVTMINTISSGECPQLLLKGTGRYLIISVLVTDGYFKALTVTQATCTCSSRLSSHVIQFFSDQLC